MEKRYRWYCLAYYLLLPATYILFLVLCSALINANVDNVIGKILVALYVYAILTLIHIVVWVRFSPLPSFVDPIAAAEVPLSIYLLLVFNGMKNDGAFISASGAVHIDLDFDGDTGRVLFALFVFGLVFSFSIRRRKRKTVAFKIINKIGKGEEKGPEVRETHRSFLYGREKKMPSGKDDRTPDTNDPG